MRGAVATRSVSGRTEDSVECLRTRCTFSVKRRYRFPTAVTPAKVVAANAILILNLNGLSIITLPRKFDLCYC